MPDWERGMWPREGHMKRVFRVRSGREGGTAFAIDISGRQYLVSALHVVKDAIDYAQIDIWKHNSWAPTIVNFVGTDVETDIAVLACAERLVGADLDIPVERDGRSGAGQEVFFIGFPFDLTGPDLGSGLVLPLIRRGIVSNFRFDEPAHMLVSALANPGFSGSPLFYVNHESGQATLTAIVASSLGYRAPVLNAQNEMIGTVEMDLNLVQCPFISYALRLIDQNPIGFRL